MSYYNLLFKFIGTHNYDVRSTNSKFYFKSDICIEAIKLKVGN